jgi:hypothetical protein
VKVPDFLPPLWHLGLHALSNRGSRLQDFESPFRLMRALSDLGAEGSLPAPPELVPMGARVLAQGYLNRVAMPLLRDWLLPRWMRRQSDPSSPLFVPRSVSNLMLNQTERSWTALGIPGADHPVESLVDRWGLLTPVPSGPSLDWWVEVDGVPGGPMAAGEQPQTQVLQRLQGGLPVVVTAYEANGLRVQSEAWLLPLLGSDWAAMQVVLFNIADLHLTGTFRFALRPYNPEGLSPIYRIELDEHNFRADGRPGPITWPRPEAWSLSSFDDGDLFRRGRGAGDTGEPPRSIFDRKGFAHGTLDFRFTIEPWEEAEFLAFMPVHRDRARDSRSSVAGQRSLFTPYSAPHTSQSALPRPLGYSRAKAATTLEWRRLLDGGMRVSIPDRDLQESWEANRCHLLALHDGDTITPGPDLYHSFWFRDAALMAYALSTCGYVEAAEGLLRGFLRRQRRNGVFVSQMGEWDGTGQVMWAIKMHLAMHPNPGLLAQSRPAVERAAHFLKLTLDRWDGLMPPGISSEHLGPPDRYYWDNLWTLAGLLAAHEMLGEPWIAGLADRLRSTISAAWERDVERCGGALPAAPGRRIDPGAVGTLTAWYPLDLMPVESPYLAATLRALEESLFYDGALFVHSGHSGWGTYLNMRVAGCYLAAGSDRGWELMRWLLHHSSPTYNWAEAIHPVSGMGSTGDGHHGWASAEWLLLVRSLLLREERSKLHIAPCVPASWMESAGCVSLSAAPTSFGLLSYNMAWDEGAASVRLELDARWRTPPGEIIWRLPAPHLRAVTVDGASVQPRAEDGAVLLPAAARIVEAAVESAESA